LDILILITLGKLKILGEPLGESTDMLTLIFKKEMVFAELTWMFLSQLPNEKIFDFDFYYFIKLLTNFIINK